MSSTEPAAARPADARVRWFEYGSEARWVDGAAEAIVDGLRTDFSRRLRARLLLSGGRTPAPIYRAVAQAQLDWSLVDVGLVDERWLRPDDPDSNTFLVRESLLRDGAEEAHFEEMTRFGRSLDDAVAAANLHARRPAGVVTLGMGDDGHTASLFPGMADFDAAIADPRAYIKVDATGCPVAGAWSRRISLTPAGLAPAHTRLLLMRGAGKRKVFERALAGDDVAELPIRIALQPDGPPLQVHWCP